MAVVDAKHQIVVHSEAFGQGQEHNLLAPVLEGVRESFKALGRDEDILEGRSLSIVLRHWPLGNYCRSPFALPGFGGLIHTALGGSAG